MGAARSAISRTCLAALTCAAFVIVAEVPGRTQGEDFVPVTDAMLQDPDAADWLMWRRTLDGWGYSPLDAITRENVGDLRMVWSRALMPGTQEGTPLAYDGVLYMPNPRDIIQAIDAVSGDLLWEHRREIIALRLGLPPKGYANWSLRLLARRVVELAIVESVSHETIRRTPKKTG